MTSSASSAGFDFVDPFGASADPARYVPRQATERALERLLRAVRDERRSAVVGGIPGIGKTLLLRLLAQRLAPELRTVHLPYASLPAAALCAWAVDLLGGRPSYDPVGAIVAHARRPHADGTGLVLLIDDAEAMPEGAATQLARAARESGGALRLVAAVAEAAAGRLVEVWSDAERVALLEPMSLEETSRYLAAHLEAAALPEAARAAFDASTLAELHRRSGGVPSLVNAEASLALRRVVVRAEERPDEAEGSEAAFERAAGRLALAHSELASEDAREEAEAAFERAAGRLTLARLEVEPSLETEAPGAEPLETGPPLEGEPPEAEPGVEGEPAGAEPLPGGEALGAEALEREPLLEGEPPAETDRPPAGVGVEAAAAGEASADAQAPPPEASRRPAWASWLIVFGVFFAVGGGVGLWLGRGWLVQPETQPAAAVPAAPAASEAGAGPAAPSLAEEAAPSLAEEAVPSLAEEAVPSLAEEAAPSLAEEAAPAAEGGEQASSALAPAPPAAIVGVQINANPWATILVDEEEVGITPLAGVPIEAGPHRFEARFPDGRVVERVVEIDEVNRFVVFP